ncbi:MAG: AAA family ATPase [Sandaracinaceae bacterium]|nr:AAA family ATPase [Sandaracinaceae bacterium]
MPITSLVLKDFTAFRQVEMEFAEGVNVFLGANATGKTHAMKAIYATLRAAADQSPLELSSRLKEKVARTFRPDDFVVGRLGHRRVGQRTARIAVADDWGKEIVWTITTASSAVKVTKKSMKEPPSCIFLPSREALSLYEGFIAAYQNRELSFDETYFDLAVSLSATGARGPKPAAINAILKELEAVLGGKVLLEGDRFYVKSPAGKIEAHLVSEGFRKIASVVRLLANNELRERGVLFWDEPEANLNPQLAVVMARVLARLAKQGIQVFVATHDYLVSETLNLLAEDDDDPTPTRFFSFTRAEGELGVEVEQADSLDDLSENLIRREFLLHYDRVRGLDA